MYSMAMVDLSPVQEGPHSALNEEEFFDALEIAYHEDEKEIVSGGKRGGGCSCS